MGGQDEGKSEDLPKIKSGRTLPPGEKKLLEEKKEMWLTELKKRASLEKCQAVVEISFWVDPKDSVENEAKQLQYVLMAIEAYTQNYIGAENIEYFLKDIIEAFRSPYKAHETQFVRKSLLDPRFKDIKNVLIQLDHRILTSTVESIENFNQMEIVIPLNAKRTEEVVSNHIQEIPKTPSFMQKIWARRIRTLASQYATDKLIKKTGIKEPQEAAKQAEILSKFLLELSEFLSEVYLENPIDSNLLSKIIENDQDDPTVFSFYLKHSKASPAIDMLSPQIKKQLINQADEMDKISKSFFGASIYLTNSMRRQITDYKNALNERGIRLFPWRNRANFNKTITLMDHFCEKLLSEEGWLAHEIGDLIEELEASLPKEKGVIGNTEDYVFDDISRFINDVRFFFLGQLFFQASPTSYKGGMGDGVAANYWPHELKVKYEKVVRSIIATLVDAGVENPTLDDVRGKMGRAFHSDYMISILNEWKEEQAIIEAYDAVLAKGIAKPTPLDVANQLRWWNVYLWGVAEPLIIKIVKKKEEEARDSGIKKSKIEPLLEPLIEPSTGGAEAQECGAIRTDAGPKICITDEPLKQRVAQRVKDLQEYSPHSTHTNIPEYDEKKEIEHENELVHSEDEARVRKYDYFKLIHEKDKTGDLTYDDVVKFGTRCCVNYIWGRRDGWFFKASNTKQMDNEIRDNLIGIFEKLSGLYGEEARRAACEGQATERRKRNLVVQS